MLHDCDLCGASHKEAHPLKQGAVVCQNCGFVYVPERRSSEEIARAWDDLWGGAYSSEWPAVKARLYYVAEYLDQTVGLKGKEVCDIGAGEGTFLDFLKINYDESGRLIGYGAKPFGVEPDEKNCRRLMVKGIPHFYGTIEQFHSVRKFDIVTILWTLENTGDCMTVLRKARELLKPDGHICIATGSRILVPFKKPLSTYFSDNPPDLHCFRWSANSLLAATAKAGFECHTFNDFMVNDWLVMVAKVGQPGTTMPDRPDLVLDYFERWEREFP